MSDVKAMVVYPFDAEKEQQLHEQTKHVQNDKLITKIQQGSGYSNLFHIIRMVLKLSQINGFNDNFNIRGNNGEFIPNTNIAKLLSLTQHRVRSQKGVSELINLLYEAKIDPNIIQNEGIKSKLNEMYNLPPSNGSNDMNDNNDSNDDNNLNDTESVVEEEDSMDTQDQQQNTSSTQTDYARNDGSTQTLSDKRDFSTQASFPVTQRSNVSIQASIPGPLPPQRSSGSTQTDISPRSDGSSQTYFQSQRRCWDRCSNIS